MTEQRFCPFCGTMTVPGAAFCVTCGQAVAAPAAAPVPLAPPAEPPPAAMPAPPAEQPAPPSAPAPLAPSAEPLPATAPAPLAPPAEPPPAAVPPPLAAVEVVPAPAVEQPAPAQAPALPPAAAGAVNGFFARLPVPPWVAVAIAAVAVVAVIAVAFVVSGAGNKPGITYDPSSLSCTGESFTVTMRLPSSVASDDYLAMLVDGEMWPAGTMWTPTEGGFVRQSDSTWLLFTTAQTPAAAECLLTVGSHAFEIVDANATVIAQGSLTRR